MMVCLFVANLGDFDPDPREKYVAQVLPDNWTFDFYYYDSSNFPVRSAAMTPRLQAKIPKMLGWDMVPPYDYYIWLDSAFRLSDRGAVRWFVEECSGHDIAFFAHHKRNSIRSELSYMQRKMKCGDQYLIQRYINEPMEQQVERYLADPDFSDTTLYAAGAFVYSRRLVNRPDNPMKEWFHQTVVCSVQDQLSLPWVLSKMKVNVRTLSKPMFANPYIEYMYTH